MALMLVQKKMTGEPVGIYLEDGKNYFRVEDSALKISGEDRVESRAPQVPWHVFVSQCTNGNPSRYVWDSVSSLKPMAETLDAEYDKWTSRESGAQVVDS